MLVRRGGSARRLRLRLSITVSSLASCASRLVAASTEAQRCALACGAHVAFFDATGVRQVGLDTHPAERHVASGCGSYDLSSQEG
jgi:hypothetical protein